MTKRRVVVTGLGCISPVGNTVESAWSNLLAGKSGIDTITKFDISAFACKIAGEVKGFNVEDFMTSKEARRDGHLHALWLRRSGASRARFGFASG